MREEDNIGHTQHFTLHLIAPWRLSFKGDTNDFHSPGNNKEISFKQIAKTLYLLSG